MDSTASSFTARNNAKRAAEKMIANGKAPAVNYGIRPRDDGRFEIVWKTAPTTGEVEAEIATAATAAEDGHYSASGPGQFSTNCRRCPPVPSRPQRTHRFCRLGFVTQTLPRSQNSWSDQSPSASNLLII